MRDPHVEYDPDPLDTVIPPEVLADPLIAPLNPEQRQAVLTTEGPVLVLAGAGSGKTRVITHRIAWIVGRMHVPGWQVLAMTFTNKAAGEMRERVAHTVGDGAAQVWLGTFHSIGVRLLRQMAGYAGLQPSFSIYDTDDQVRLIGRISEEAKSQLLAGVQLEDGPAAFSKFEDVDNLVVGPCPIPIPHRPHRAHPRDRTL